MKLFHLVKKILRKNNISEKQQNLRERLDFAMSQSKEI